MKLRSDNNLEKRRRKIINKGPVLVRSVKPGQALSASYTKENQLTQLWRA
jgi:hypothetical protein